MLNMADRRTMTYLGRSRNRRRYGKWLYRIHYLCDGVTKGLDAVAYSVEQAKLNAVRTHRIPDASCIVGVSIIAPCYK